MKHLYRKELDKDCFAHDAAYSESKDLVKRTISDKILKDRTYEIARNRNYDEHQRALASMVYKFFDKKTGCKQLAEELHKPVTKKFKRRKVYARFKDNICSADLAEMGLFSSRNKNIKYLLCVIDVFAKYAWANPLKEKKSETVLNAFIKMVNECSCKPNKLWVD